MPRSSTSKCGSCSEDKLMLRSETLPPDPDEQPVELPDEPQEPIEPPERPSEPPDPERPDPDREPLTVP
jgi:hypothetical protein